MSRCPSRGLFQHDNQTGAVFFKPQYGGCRLLVEFLRRPGQALEICVGKSAHVDFLLDLDHQGHTVSCWSLAGRILSREIEWRSTPMEMRIEAMRFFQQAGYPARMRFSPVIPVKNRRAENAEMIARLFEAVRPMASPWSRFDSRNAAGAVWPASGPLYLQLRPLERSGDNGALARRSRAENAPKEEKRRLATRIALKPIRRSPAPAACHRGPSFPWG